MKASKIPAFTKGLVNVVIETPKGSQNKYAFDSKYRVFTLKKSLPMGSVFPFDFGFIPSTKGQDGDPLDMLVIMDQPSYPGCHIKCRIVGVLIAEQIEKHGKKVRNDLFVGIADCSVEFESINHIKELSKSLTEQIENFFIDYNRQEGKKFIAEKWESGDKAKELIKAALIN